MKKEFVVAFYRVDGDYDRHSFDDLTDEEAYELLLALSEDECKMYNLSTYKGTGPVYDLADFESDYNDELLDGGWWMKVLCL